MPGTAHHVDRQAGEPWGGQVPGDALGRAQEARGPTQGGEDFAPAHATARAADAAVRVSRTGSAPLLRPRWNNSLFLLRHHRVPVTQYRAAGIEAFVVWAEITGVAVPQ